MPKLVIHAYLQLPVNLVSCGRFGLGYWDASQYELPSLVRIVEPFRGRTKDCL